MRISSIFIVFLADFFYFTFREAINEGFNHFKVKVGGSVEDDARRLRLVRSIIDDPEVCAGRQTPAPETLVGKNAGPTGSVLMIDANQGKMV